MARLVIVLSKWFLRAGLALTVLIMGLGYDPAPSLHILQGWTLQTVSCTQHLVGDFRVSKTSGELMLNHNIGGLRGLPSRLDLKQFLSSTGIVINEPVDMMTSHLKPIKNFTVSASAMADPRLVPLDSLEDFENQESDVDADIVIDEHFPPVAIYCTHNAETYLPDDNRTHSKSERGLINDVGLALAMNLSQLKFRAVFVDTVHDSPDYSKSYINSRETVEQLLEEEDNWGAIIDVHRDSIPQQNSPWVVDIKGKKAAQILIIVGSDQRKTNSKWKKNLQFAEKISHEAQQRYPGLIRGVRVKPGTYNQDLYSPTILLEIGNENNSLEQAKYGVSLFAEILALVLLEGS